MTTVTFTVGGINYSNYVLQADIWRESLTGIGRWEVILDPYPNFWGGMFALDQVVTISIDGTLMMEGYIDDVKPFLADTGTFTVLYRLTGRDYGIDLALLYISAFYRNTRADDIVQAALIASGGEIRFGSPSAAGIVDYEFDRTFLADGIRELAQLVGYDFYVNNTMALGVVAMNFFPVGDPLQHTAVDLICDANSLTNNILGFDMGEVIGAEVANRVEAIAGPLKDHWTDLNATDYTGIFSNVVDETVVYIHGKGAIRATNNTGGLASIGMELQFPLYNHTSLDMSESGTGKYDYIIHDTNNATKAVNIRLRDTSLNWIEYYKAIWGGMVKCFDCTNQPDNDQYRTVSFPIGEESGIEAVLIPGNTKGHWYDFATPAPPFDWTQVDRIRFICSGLNVNATDYFIVDGLNFSNTEVISVATDPAPLGGTRMLPAYRYDIKNQVELDAFAAWKLTRSQDPLENIQITAIGQTGSLYAGQSLDVRIATYIPNLTQYRIFELHHQVVKSSDESLEPGYTFITEYNLVRHEFVAGGTQLITPEKALFPVSPVKADLRKKRGQLYVLDRHGQTE